MNWKNIIIALETRGLTPTQIASAVGMSSSSHVGNIKAGRQSTVTWEVGEALLRLFNPRMKPRKGVE